MIKLYYGPNIDLIMWKIHMDLISFDVYIFPTNSTPIDVFNKLCQLTLFSSISNKNVIVNVSNWNIDDKNNKYWIKVLNNLHTEIFFAYETSLNIKNKIFNDLSIISNKVTFIDQKIKKQFIKILFDKNNIDISDKAMDIFVNLLWLEINFVKNEVNKLSLLSNKWLIDKNISQIVFSKGDYDVFKIINYWLKNNINKIILLINNLLKNNLKITDIAQIFIHQLIKLKFYVEAIENNWSQKSIQLNLNIPIWLQQKYVLFIATKNILCKIDLLLLKLYNFDIVSKSKKSDLYCNFIKIFLDSYENR